MLKRIAYFLGVSFVLCFTFLASSPSQASTSRHQFQLGTGFGVFVGTKGLDPSFDIDLEPEYFLTDHISLSFRFDGTVGGVDSVHFGGRFRYYLTFAQHPRFSIYFGAGAGGGVVFDGGGGFGDIAIPVFGFQYDLTKHIKLGSDVSFDIVFNSNDVAFATRLMPVQFKWAF
ncbi:MAG: hypothetical protein U1F57_10825 [bacterium]